MGLFSNNKKPCPICGNATPRLLATKISGIPICSDCASKIDLPIERSNALTMPEFQDYLKFYDENASLRNVFAPTNTQSFDGFLNTSELTVDTANKLFKIKISKDAIVFPGGCLRSIVIREDDRVLMELSAEGLKISHSDTPDAVRAMRGEIEAFNHSRVIEEGVQNGLRQQELQKRHREGNYKDYEVTRAESSSMRFHPKLPFEKFHFEVTLDHPWWEKQTGKLSAPFFDDEHPSVTNYLEEYENTVERFKVFLMNFRAISFPDCPVIDNRESVSIDSVPHAADEIKKFKELLDMGILTKEEFNLKKNQLLGL